MKKAVALRRIILVLFIVANQLYCQTDSLTSATNLALWYQFVDSSLTTFSVADKNWDVSVVLPRQAELLESRIRERISAGLMARPAGSGNSGKIIYQIENAQLQYPDLFRDGLLGDYYVVRRLLYKGSIQYVQGASASVKPFSYMYLDTIAVDRKSQIETQGYSLTEAALPKEPLGFSLLEPLVVVTTLAITVYLFFTVRKGN